MKHIEIDCHFIREKFLSEEIFIEFANSSDQLANILSLFEVLKMKFICSKDFGIMGCLSPTLSSMGCLVEY
ncbi:hypothetical protein CR513_25578, partial [Mucuna pruriens]